MCEGERERQRLGEVSYIIFKVKNAKYEVVM